MSEVGRTCTLHMHIQYLEVFPTRLSSRDAEEKHVFLIEDWIEKVEAPGSSLILLHWFQMLFYLSFLPS